MRAAAKWQNYEKWSASSVSKARPRCSMRAVASWPDPSARSNAIDVPGPEKADTARAGAAAATRYRTEGGGQTINHIATKLVVTA